MSMHKTPLTPLEHQGLMLHKLPIGTPSMLSDTFRIGMKWAFDSMSEDTTQFQKTNIDDLEFQEWYTDWKELNESRFGFMEWYAIDEIAREIWIAAKGNE